MKVPFLKRKIQGEFSAYLEEFEASVKSSMDFSRSNEGETKKLFFIVYPLFVLLRCLSASEYVRNPARDAVLSELIRAGDKDRFSAALTSFNRKKAYHEELLSGLQKTVFTGYFDELFSDILMLLNSFYTYNYRGAMMSTRCMLEDLYRHLYYMDHPQEFFAVSDDEGNGEYGLGITPQKLREFLSRTSYLKVFHKLNIKFLPKGSDEMTIFSLNDNLYRQCSTYVHGAAKSAFNSLKSNADLERSEDKERLVIQVVGEFVKMSVAFLVAAHMDHIMAVNEYEKSIILAAFSKNERSAFRRALNI